MILNGNLFRKVLGTMYQTKKTLVIKDDSNLLVIVQVEIRTMALVANVLVFNRILLITQATYWFRVIF